MPLISFLVFFGQNSHIYFTLPCDKLGKFADSITIFKRSKKEFLKFLYIFFKKFYICIIIAPFLPIYAQYSTKKMLIRGFLGVNYTYIKKSLQNVCFLKKLLLSLENTFANYHLYPLWLQVFLCQYIVFYACVFLRL